jgi:hypothetical protein
MFEKHLQRSTRLEFELGVVDVSAISDRSPVVAAGLAALGRGSRSHRFGLNSTPHARSAAVFRHLG